MEVSNKVNYRSEKAPVLGSAKTAELVVNTEVQSTRMEAFGEVLKTLGLREVPGKDVENTWTVSWVDGNPSLSDKNIADEIWTEPGKIFHGESLLAINEVFGIGSNVSLSIERTANDQYFDHTHKVISSRDLQSGLGYLVIGAFVKVPYDMPSDYVNTDEHNKNTRSGDGVHRSLILTETGGVYVVDSVSGGVSWKRVESTGYSPEVFSREYRVPDRVANNTSMWKDVADYVKIVSERKPQ